jgi:hypothetical protein
MKNDLTPETVLAYLQTDTQALQQVLKAFEKQQAALISGNAEGLLATSQSAEAALLALAEAQSPDYAERLQDTSALHRSFEQEAPTQTRRLQLLLEMRHKLLQSLKVRRQENEALIQQAQHLNEAQLSHLVALHQNTQPVVYGAQGDNAPDFQASRSAYDFSA